MEQIENILAELRSNKNRFRLWYGDNVTGKSWEDEYDTIGTVGRSTGTKPIYLLIKNSRSLGGGAIMPDAIVKIVNITTGRELYKHPNFNQRTFVNEGLQVLADGEIYANCKDAKQAERLALFMNGKRHCN